MPPPPPSALSALLPSSVPFTWRRFAAALLLAGILHLNEVRFGCAGDTFRIGRRTPGDRVVLKKVLLSVPSSMPANHTVIYEYRATEAVSCIEYQVADVATSAAPPAFAEESSSSLSPNANQTFPSRCAADIAFTGEYSLAATFHLVNITELVIVMSIYGFDRFSVPLDFRPILVPQFLHRADGGAPKFGLGFRRPADELVYFYTQQTQRTPAAARNHSLVFEARLEHYITYATFAVDVSWVFFLVAFLCGVCSLYCVFFLHQSKTAGVTFLLMSEHEFRGMVYDSHAHILFANLYVYGYKRDKLPADYVPLLPTRNNGSAVNGAHNRTQNHAAIVGQRSNNASGTIAVVAVETKLLLPVMLVLLLLLAYAR